MEKTWKPKVAGIIDIATAVISLWFLAALSLEGAVFWAIFPKSMFGINTQSIVYLIVDIPLLGMTILALIGGINALNRRKWKLVLVGSIAAIFAWTPVVLLVTPALIFGTTTISILAVILLTKSKAEFR